MKSTKLLLTVLIISSAILSSCSIQRRYHRDGLNISWNHSSWKKDKNTEPIDQDKESTTLTQSAVISNRDLQTEPSTFLTSDDNASIEYTANYTASNDQVIENTVEIESTPISIPQTTEKRQADKSPREKTMKQQFSTLKKDVKSKNYPDEDDFILYVVLAFFIPPLAVFLYEGSEWTSRCTANLILTLLCGLPGLIHALVIILGRR